MYCRRMVESHMHIRRSLQHPLLSSSMPWQPNRKLSFLLSLFSPILPSLALLPCTPRYPFCLCKARAGKVVSSAFGRLIALAYSTKFGHAVLLSGEEQEFSPSSSFLPRRLLWRSSLIHLNAH